AARGALGYRLTPRLGLYKEEAASCRCTNVQSPEYGDAFFKGRKEAWRDLISPSGSAARCAERLCLSAGNLGFRRSFSVSAGPA
ncbi:MAG: hypothetical protein L0312_07140, partial [Acidobacteria bacterium]|nr:hypothetical protein [Acidobacteriota bacterium]